MKIEDGTTWRLAAEVRRVRADFASTEDAADVLMDDYHSPSYRIAAVVPTEITSTDVWFEVWVEDYA